MPRCRNTKNQLRLALPQRLLLGLALAWLQVSSACGGDLKSKLQALVDAHHGEAAVAVKHLTRGETFYHRAEQPMPTASLIKFPVMVEAYRQAQAGEVDLNAMVELQEKEKSPGSGILSAHFSDGAKISLRDAIRLMIAYSDNTATNLVLDQIGIASTAAQMERLGMPHTKLHAKVYRRETSVFPERSKEFGLGSTTASETLRLYELLHDRKLVSKDASEAMLGHLLACEDKSKLGQNLPRGVKLAHKSGAITSVRCDAGIIFSPGGPIGVCVLTRKNRDRRWSNDSEANRLCGAIAREAYEHFNPTPPPQSATPSPLMEGASGPLVESLQRTLNARLKPSPELSVDGEFGPQTKAAVSRLQTIHDLASSGRMNPATWKALGPLVSVAASVRTPQEVNAEKLPKSPLEPLDGPPFVTCRAWSVMDAKTGKILWGQAENEKLNFASTTKIMTAYLVLKLAQDQPRVLDEEIVFSQRADETRGSTSGVRKGERLSVRECLYGLLLPSGNDAAVALSEHFGDRLRPQSKKLDRSSAKTTAAKNSDIASDSEVANSNLNKPDPLEGFLAAMNEAAQKLGMQQTSFRNPHGLTARGHLSTASDLARLTHAALQLPSFCKYVQTRQHGVTLLGPGGYQRNVVWKNTNRLLSTTGYLGVKTGTTSAAGACLVSTAVRGQDQLILVVLGAKSSDARYVDTRNLYRWAWLQRGHVK